MSFTKWRSLVDGTEIDYSAIPDSGNLQSDYDADSYSLNDGDTITSAWADAAGSFDAAVNGDPTFNASAINGEPAVDLDPTDDYFDTGFVQDTSNPRSLYIVWFIPTASSARNPWGAIDTSGSTTRSYPQLTGSDEYVTAYGDNAAIVSGGVEGQWVIWSVIAGGGSQELFENGSSKVSGSYSANGSVGFNDYIGAQNLDGSADKLSGGEIARILRYNVAHGSSTRQDVESFLNNQYAVY